jgi:surface polysaccharide O-acyltransferase-like enzyme
MKARILYLDAARCCACLLVVASHIFAPIVAAMTQTTPSAWWLFNLADSVIRPSAAIYVMLSGVLFLGSSHEESYPTFIWKRYAKVVPPFFVWSLIYVYAYGNQDTFHLGRAVLQVLSGPTAYHLWFMYMILALYLVMPVLKRFVQTAEPTDLAAFLAVWWGFLVLRFCAPGYVGEGPATTLLSYGGYAVLGAVLARRPDSFLKNTGAWFGLWLGIVLFNAVGTYWLTIHNHGTMNEKLYFGASPLVALQAATMFILIKRLGNDSWLFQSFWTRTAIKSFSRHSYDVYLIHALVITLVADYLPRLDVSKHLMHQPVATVTLDTLMVLGLSLGLSVILSRIPVVSQLFVLSPTKQTQNNVKGPKMIPLELSTNSD